MAAGQPVSATKKTAASISGPIDAGAKSAAFRVRAPARLISRAEAEPQSR
jgi:hypothetical protein